MARLKSDEIRLLEGTEAGHGESIAPADATMPDWRLASLAPISFRDVQHIVPSAWHQHAPFAFWLVDALKPRTLVELGAHNGFSYFAFCQAVRMAGLGTAAYAVDLWMGDEHAGFYGEEVFRSVWQHNQDQYRDFSTLMKMSFNDALAYFSDASIDLLHIDGRHHYEDVKADFETWLPKLSERAVVLFHDTNVREREFGVHRFWEALSARYPSFTFVHGHGLGVLGIGSALPDPIKALFQAGHDAGAAAAIKAAYARLGAVISARFEAEAAVSLERRKVDDLAGRVTALTAHAAELEQRGAAANAALEATRGELAQAGQDKRDLAERVAGLECNLAERMAVLEQAAARLQDNLALKTASLEAATAVQVEREQELQRRHGEIARLTLELRQASQDRQTSADELRAIRSSPPYALTKAARAARRSLGAVRRRLRHGQAAPLFDARWYLGKYPDVARAGVDPFAHYLRAGAAAGRDPHPLFSTSWYLANNLDVAAQGVNPLVHFCRFGGRELRSPHPLFDCAWYVRQHPALVESGLNPLQHYLDTGAREGADPHPLFDTSWYLANNPDVAGKGINPLVHFVGFGARELRMPHPLFDCGWYLDQNPDVLAGGMNPLEHYLRAGAREGRDPNPAFDTDWYRATYLGADSANPLVHYVTEGLDKGLAPNPRADSNCDADTTDR